VLKKQPFVLKNTLFGTAQVKTPQFAQNLMVHKLTDWLITPGDLHDSTAL
jgi:hypothetical protein